MNYHEWITISIDWWATKNPLTQHIQATNQNLLVEKKHQEVASRFHRPLKFLPQTITMMVDLFMLVNDGWSMLIMNHDPFLSIQQLKKSPPTSFHRFLSFCAETAAAATPLCSSTPMSLQGFSGGQVSAPDPTAHLAQGSIRWRRWQVQRWCNGYGGFDLSTLVPDSFHLLFHHWLSDIKIVVQFFGFRVRGFTWLPYANTMLKILTCCDLLKWRLLRTMASKKLWMGPEDLQLTTSYSHY